MALTPFSRMSVWARTAETPLRTLKQSNFCFMFRDFPQVFPKSSQHDYVNTWEALKHDTMQHLAPTTRIAEHKASCSSVHQCACGMSTAGLSSIYGSGLFCSTVHA